MPGGRKPQTKAEVLLRLGLLLIGVVFLGVLAFFSVLGAWHMFEKERAATDAADAAQRQLALVVSQQQEVQGQVEQLSTQTGTEAALRQQYGVVKPGEGVIQIVENEPMASTSNASSSRSVFGEFGEIVHVLWPW